MSEEITQDQMQQIAADVAARHPNVKIVMPGQYPQAEALMGSIFAGVEMIAAVAEAARDCVEARPDLGPDKLASMMMIRHGRFLLAWNEDLDDRARTELMCVYAAAAVNAKVSVDDIAGDQLHHIYARDLLELAYETAATGVPLVPDPVNPMNTPLWCYAVSTVCDSSDPELAKIRAVCLLASAAATAEASAADGAGA